jgi:hypothetical protein
MAAGCPPAPLILPGPGSGGWRLPAAYWLIPGKRLGDFPEYHFSD